MIQNDKQLSKSLAKSYISVATTYFQLGNKKDSILYFEKAEKLFTQLGNPRTAKDIQKKKDDLFNQS
jgi:hypothetical protein